MFFCVNDGKFPLNDSIFLSKVISYVHRFSYYAIINCNSIVVRYCTNMQLLFDNKPYPYYSVPVKK